VHFWYFAATSLGPVKRRLTDARVFTKKGLLWHFAIVVVLRLPMARLCARLAPVGLRLRPPPLLLLEWLTTWRDAGLCDLHSGDHLSSDPAYNQSRFIRSTRTKAFSLRCGVAIQICLSVLTVVPF